MKMARRIPVAFVMSVLCNSAGFGQSHPLYLHHLSRADGLLHDNTTCVTNDPYGFIWIGTHRGINRYDGYQLAGWNYPGNDANPDRVYGMALSRSKLLLATEAGLIGFDPRRPKPDIAAMNRGKRQPSPTISTHPPSSIPSAFNS